MHIEVDLLIAWGAVARKYSKSEFVFYENDPCKYYYQILDGRVKMCCYNEDGKVFIQGMFESGESFGEPPLFISLPYPACAVTESVSVIYRLPKETFVRLLEEYPALKMQFLTGFARRIYDKSARNKDIVNAHPDQKIRSFLDNYKLNHSSKPGKTFIPMTRQQIADSLGLRVETVIRTLLKMEEKGVVEIIKHKLYY